MGMFLYHKMGKRLLDLGLALFGVVLTLPLLVLACIALRITAPGPVLFAQTRVGRGGRLFTLYKLRSMTVDPDRSVGQTHPGDPGILPVGRWFRRFKIDELPQLWNVIRGDMSLVGPRPYVPAMHRKMPSWAQGRMDHRPGLTGLAQVSGNTTLTWHQRWAFDAQYYPQAWGDVAIILCTIAVVIRGDAPKDHSTVTDLARLRG